MIVLLTVRYLDFFPQFSVPLKRNGSRRPQASNPDTPVIHLFRATVLLA
jgi:hypothetical protein